MKTLITTTFLLLLIHANATTQLIHGQKDQALIETTCKNTPNYHLCVSVLRANPGSATADVAGLALIMVGVVKSKANQAISLINKLRSAPSPALDKCKEVYEAVIKADVPEAVEALTKGDPKFAENGMADAAVEADVCEGRFGGKKSPLSGVNKNVKDHAVVARAIIRNLL